MGVIPVWHYITCIFQTDKKILFLKGLESVSFSLVKINQQGMNCAFHFSYWNILLFKLLNASIKYHMLIS
jgi:hypothetical protein